MQNFILPNIEHKPVGFYSISTSILKIGDYTINDAIDKLNIGDKIVLHKGWTPINIFKETYIDYNIQKGLFVYEDESKVKIQQINNTVKMFIKIKATNIGNDNIDCIYLKLPIEYTADDIYTNNSITIDKNIVKIDLKNPICPGSIIDIPFHSIDFNIII